ncbi:MULTISPECIES: hypothetical protein [Streptomyces]|nr:hypothetical protein [Streptomyces sp. KAI 90]NUV93011.1 hypothetical protein [Streptomyces sp. KAI 90]
MSGSTRTHGTTTTTARRVACTGSTEAEPGLAARGPGLERPEAGLAVRRP